MFTKYFLPKFGITHRYVGTEPNSPMTAQYNAALKQALPIPVREIPRLEQGGIPVSASRVRSLLGTGQADKVQPLVPPTTFAYLQRESFL